LFALIFCIQFYLITSLDSHASEAGATFTALERLNSQLDESYLKFEEQSEPLLQITKNDERYQLTLNDSKKIRLIIAEYLENYNQAISQFQNHYQALNVSMNKQSSILMLSEIIRISSISKFFSLVLDAPPIGIILFESDWGLHNTFIRESLVDIQMQLHPNTRLRYYDQRHRPLMNYLHRDDRPTLADVISDKRSLYTFARLATQNDIEASSIFKTAEQSIDSYYQTIQSINNRMNTYFRSSAISQHLYNVKSFLLYLTGLIYLPKEYGLQKSDVISQEHRLEPGDISLISHELKLTNVAFPGVWTHAILYLGAPKKLFSYFDGDAETTKYYQTACEQENLNCHSFESYFQKKYPDKFKQYTQKVRYEGDPVELKTIESKGDGVIFSDIFSALRKDRWANLRPRLSKLEKSISILRAISYVGTPYDYDFDVLTQSKLVCTEMIVNIYDFRNYNTDTSFRWSSSVAIGRKVYYATDIGRTYFESPEKRLNFVFMLTPDSRPGVAPRLGDEKEFKATLY
jgi:hypothetical protein